MRESKCSLVTHWMVTKAQMARSGSRRDLLRTESTKHKKEHNAERAKVEQRDDFIRWADGFEHFGLADRIPSATMDAEVFRYVSYFYIKVTPWQRFMQWLRK